MPSILMATENGATDMESITGRKEQPLLPADEETVLYRRPDHKRLKREAVERVTRII